jgi:hypothetical protein
MGGPLGKICDLPLPTTGKSRSRQPGDPGSGHPFGRFEAERMAGAAAPHATATPPTP